MTLDATQILFAVTRAIHFGACLLMLGVWIFDRLIADRASRQSVVVADCWPRIARAIFFFSLPLALISGIGWFALIAINMSGLPVHEALQTENLKLVWNATEFGKLWKIRFLLWIAAAILGSVSKLLRRSLRYAEEPGRTPQNPALRRTSETGVYSCCWVLRQGLVFIDSIRRNRSDHCGENNVAANSCSLSPVLGGEGWGEGPEVKRRNLPHRPSSQPSPPSTGEKEQEPARQDFFRNDLTIWLALATTAALAASLAWAGHGLFDCCNVGPMLIRGRLHLATDAAHILIGAVWPAGLLPLAMLIRRLQRDGGDDKWLTLSHLVNRFSTTSIVAVALIIVTGVLNSWPLVGSISNLLTTTYGRVLLVKIIAFVLMLVLGSVNLLYLKPRLACGGVTALKWTVWIEVSLGVVVLLVVGLLGLLPPSVDMCCMPGM